MFAIVKRGRAQIDMASLIRTLIAVRTLVVAVIVMKRKEGNVTGTADVEGNVIESAMATVMVMMMVMSEHRCDHEHEDHL